MKPATHQQRVEYARAVAAVTQVLRVSVDDLYSRSRTATTARARAIVAFLLVRGHGWTMQRVGLHLCRHHTSIISSCNRVEWMLRRDARFRALVFDIILRLQQHSKERQHGVRKALDPITEQVQRPAT